MPDDDHADRDSDNQPSKKLTLTPIRAHYLKKVLIQLEFARELQSITAEALPNVSTLSYLGQPFSPLPEDVSPADIPFLKYIFRQFVLTFPFMAAAPKDFYSQKLQPFVAALIARGITPTSVLDDEVQEDALQKKILQRLERNLTLFLGSAIKLVEPEEVVRLTQADLNRLEALTAQRERRRAKSKDSFDVNIVSVRTIIEKGRMRNRPRDEFIIRTRRSRYPDVFVSRRYGDFRTLYQELIKAHPEEDIRSPPPKDHTEVKAPARTLSVSTTPGSSSSRDLNIISTHNSSRPPTPRNSGLAREKNRLTLRSYLHSLLSSSTIASSPVIRSFLLSGATTLSEDELEDTKRREEADKLREEGRKRFAKEIMMRVDHLRDSLKTVKGEVMEKDGLRRFFSTIKETPDLQSLPGTYHSVAEWARFSFASTVYNTYVASDEASESFAGLKRFHSQMPYFMMKAALRITNPVTMIRNVMDLFLATPFGGRSLLQRMFTSSLTEEVKLLEEEIQVVMNKVDDPVMCTKIRQFVYSSRDIQKKFKDDANKQQTDITIIFLRSSDSPVLSRSQMGRLSRAHTAHVVYLKQKACLEDSDEDEGPQDEDGWLIEDLRVLAHLYSKMKDREQLISLIFEGFTSELLKDILTIFYSPLAQVYRAANIADSLSDLQNFISDLIRTIEAVEMFDQRDTHTILQAFIDLIRRHEQAFYTFIHKVHSKGEGLFTDLMQWIELFLTGLRDGLGEGVSVEFLLPHTSEEREQIISEIDKVVLYHYKLKILYEEKLRRRFGRVQGNSTHPAADAEDGDTQGLLDSITGDLSFGELAAGDALDLAAQETDEESSSEDYSATEDSSDESDSQGSTLENSLTTPLTSRSAQAPQNTQRHTPPPIQHERPTTSQHNSIPEVPEKRRRSLSLRGVRSLMSLNNGIPRRNQDIPPVPPLPVSVKRAGTLHSNPLPRKPLPPRSMSQLYPPRTGLPQETGSQTQVPQPRPRRPKNIKQSLKPPDLQLIPQLLPIFVEMMRPSLRIRKTTQ